MNEINEITYECREIPAEDEIRRLYEAVGWQAYLQEFERLMAGIENSTLVLTARRGEELVGFLRAVGDEYTSLYIQDILVLPTYQGRGIGGELLTRCLEHFPDVRQKIVLADRSPRLKKFYREHGFTVLTEESEVNAFVKFSS